MPPQQQFVSAGQPRMATRVAMVVCILSLALCFQQGWARSTTGLDLQQYYVPARMWLEGRNPYDTALYPAYVHQIVPDAPDYTYACPLPPHALLLMAPLALLPWAAAIKAWWIFLFLCLLASFAALVRLYGEEWSPTERWLIVAVLAQSRLIQSVAYRGQVAPFIMALVLAALLANRQRRPALAGLAAGIACMKYTLAMPLLLLWLWRREWRALAVTVGVALVGGLIASLRIGVGGVAQGLLPSMSVFTKLTAAESVGNYHVTHWQAIFLTLFGMGAPLARLLNLLLLVVSVAVLALVCRRWRDGDTEGWVFAAMVMLGMAAIYHRVYDGIFLFVLAAVLWNRLRRAPRNAGLYAFGTTLACFLFVLAIQSVSERVAALLAARGGLSAFVTINAWVCLLLLAQTFWFAYDRARAHDREAAHPDALAPG